MWCWVRHWTPSNLSFLPCKRELSVLRCSGLTKHFGNYKVAPYEIVMGCTVTIRPCQVVTPFRSFLLQHSHSSVSLVNVITEHRSVQLLMNDYRSLWGSFSSFVVLHIISLWSAAHTSQRQTLLWHQAPCFPPTGVVFQVQGQGCTSPAEINIRPGCFCCPCAHSHLPLRFSLGPHNQEVLPGTGLISSSTSDAPNPPAWPHSTAFGFRWFSLLKAEIKLNLLHF